MYANRSIHLVEILNFGSELSAKKWAEKNLIHNVPKVKWNHLIRRYSILPRQNYTDVYVQIQWIVMERMLSNVVLTANVPKIK